MSHGQKGEGFPGQRIVVLPRQVVAQAGQHPLLRGLRPTDAGYFPKAKGHLRQRPAGATETIFIYCPQGGGWCELDGRRHVVKAGELLVIPPGVPHRYGANENHPWTIHWFHAIGEDLPYYLNELGVTRRQPVIALGADARVLALFAEVYDILDQGYAPARLLYAAQVLAHLLGVMIWLRPGAAAKGTTDSRQRILHSVEYMKQHLEKPLRVAQLAAIANLSVSHYSALFTACTGYAPIDYFIRLRMHRACQLLDTTGSSVKEVAGALGYEDPLYFSRVFRSVNDLPPTEYRRTHKG